MMGASVLCLIFITVVFADKHDPIVTITNGNIRGTMKKTLAGTEYSSFEGIPYAAPPVGNRRFKAPEALGNWKDTLEAKNNSHICLQPNRKSENTAFNPIGAEDCLYLNVYSPLNLKTKINGYLPVLVWIHGGAYQYGSKQPVTPSYLLDYDVLVVTINYRLGVLGFLSTQDDVIPGNLGLKDQQFAMQWISKNIKHFGGDPNKVTLAGQSAGAISVSYQLLDKKNKGLFRGAILESGSSLCHHDFQSTPKPIAYELGRLVDPLFKDNSEDLLQTLRKLSAEKIMEMAYDSSLRSKFLPLDNPGQPDDVSNLWLPVVENGSESNHLISMPMHQAFIDGNFIKIPMIAGFNSEESIWYLSSNISNNKIQALKIDNNASLLINDKLNVKNKLEAGKKLKSAYSDSFAENPASILQFVSDNLYTTPVLRQADLVNKHVPVYLYQFSYKISSDKNVYVPGAENVGHAEELSFIFGETKFLNETDHLIHKRMMKLWTNFIKYQDPTPHEDSLLIKWTNTTSNLDYLNINKTLEMLQHPKKYEAWKTVLDEYMSPPLWVY